VTLYESLMEHLDRCHQCGAVRGLPCYAAEKLLQAIAQEAAERIAPIPPTPEKV